MSLTKNQLDSLLEQAMHAAHSAGKIITSYQGEEVSYELKEGGTSIASKIVTQVDAEAEGAILDILNSTIAEYDLGLLTEESTDDQSRFEKDYFWCVDPLDGTLPFTKNESGYATSIALVSREGHSVLGVVFDPRNNNLYTAIKGHGAYKNHKPLYVTDSSAQVIVDNGPGGAVMQAISTIDNSPSVFFKKPKSEQGGGCLWDYAASSVIHREAGGYNSDFNLNRLNLNAVDSVFMNHCGVLYSAGISQGQLKEILSGVA